MKLNALFVSATLLVTLVSPASRAATTFQGIYKLTKDSKPAGILIIKTEKLANGNVKMTYHVQPSGTPDYETSVMETDATYRPLNYETTRTRDANIVRFKGSLKGGTFATTRTSEVSTNANVKASASQTVQVPPAVQFPALLAESLKAKGLLRSGASTTVVQITDEPGILVGDVTVGAPENIRGAQVLPVKIEPKHDKPPLLMWATPEGELVRIGVEGQIGELVPTIEEALENPAADKKRFEAVMGGPVTSQYKVQLAPPVKK